MPTVEQGGDLASLPMLSQKLLIAPNFKKRWELVDEEALHCARAEVRTQSRGRLERARDRLERKVLGAVARALQASDVNVDGIEVQPTIGGHVFADRSQIPPEHLVHAHIDIVAGSLTEGGATGAK